MRGLRAAVAALLGAGALVPSGAGAYITGLAEGMPFVGDWDCGVAVFQFATDHYRPGADSDPLPYVRIEALDADTRRPVDDARTATEFVLTFDDAYQIGLSNVTATTMSWFSGASGDAFDCVRIAP